MAGACLPLLSRALLLLLLALLLLPVLPALLPSLLLLLLLLPLAPYSWDCARCGDAAISAAPANQLLPLKKPLLSEA